MNFSLVPQAVSLLRAGQTVAIPTETVYGLAADALNPQAVAQIFQIKNRPTFDPLIVHVATRDHVHDYVESFPVMAQKLADRFWPGPLTLTLPKKKIIPDLVTSGLSSVAIRIPSHPLAQALLHDFGGPLAAPSANRFGRISPTTAEAVRQELGSAVPLILDGGPCGVGLESTIIQCDGNEISLLRAGGIPLEEIEKITGPLTLNNRATHHPQAPGQLAYHYAPAKPLRLLEREKILALPNPQHIGVLTWGSWPAHPFVHWKNLSPTENFTEAAAHFFQMLRELDQSAATEIVATLLPEENLGRAINERLHRAAAPRPTHLKN